MSDVQIFTGLAILISGFVSLCPSPTQPNGLPAYHWQVLVHLAWFSTITHQGTLFLLQEYFREHRWQRNVRLLLMCTLLVLLIIAMLPTAFFNWYSKRTQILLIGPSDSRDFVPEDWLVTYFTLAKSAAQPVSPALCYFNLSSANSLYRSADPCRWSDFTPLRPPRLTAAATVIIRRAITYQYTSLSATTGDMSRLPGEAGLDHSPSPSSDIDARREQYCDFHTQPFGTFSFQSAVFGMLSLVVLSLWNAARLFSLPSAFFRRRIRNPISRYSRLLIENASRRATHVTTPLLALHLTGRLVLDMFTSKLAKVSSLIRQSLSEIRRNNSKLIQHQVLLLIFAFVQGCIRLYPAHDPYFHIVQREGWTFGQILAVLSPLSPLALVVHELFNGGSRAWHASSNQPEHMTTAAVITQTDDPSHTPGIELRAVNDGNVEANGSGLDRRQVRTGSDQGEGSSGPAGATSLLDSPEYRSSKWMSIKVWILVITVTHLAYTELIHIDMAHSDPESLPRLIFGLFATFAATSYAWVLMGLSIWSRSANYNSGYHHDSRLTTSAARPDTFHLMMMLPAAFTSLGFMLLSFLNALFFQGRSPLNTPPRTSHLFGGSDWATWICVLEVIAIILEIVAILVKRVLRRRA